LQVKLFIVAIVIILSAKTITCHGRHIVYGIERHAASEKLENKTGLHTELLVYTSILLHCMYNVQNVALFD